MNSRISSQPQSAKKRHVARWALLAAALLIIVGLMAWWPRGGSDEAMLLLGPRFRVTATSNGTVSFEREYEGFVVQCQPVCGDFKVGQGYALLYRQRYLEYRSKGKSYALPVIQYRFHPNTVEGGKG